MVGVNGSGGVLPGVVLVMDPAGMSRLELQQAIFKMADTDGDGRLESEELRVFAGTVGFDGNDAEWAKEFKTICEARQVDDEWLGPDDFVAMLNDDETDDGLYCSDRQLRKVYNEFVQLRQAEKTSWDEMHATPGVAPPPVSTLPLNAESLKWLQQQHPAVPRMRKPVPAKPAAAAAPAPEDTLGVRKAVPAERAAAAAPAPEDTRGVPEPEPAAAAAPAPEVTLGVRKPVSAEPAAVAAPAPEDTLGAVPGTPGLNAMVGLALQLQALAAAQEKAEKAAKACATPKIQAQPKPSKKEYRQKYRALLREGRDEVLSKEEDVKTAEVDSIGDEGLPMEVLSSDSSDEELLDMAIQEGEEESSDEIDEITIPDGEEEREDPVAKARQICEEYRDKGEWPGPAVEASKCPDITPEAVGSSINLLKRKLPEDSNPSNNAEEMALHIGLYHITYQAGVPVTKTKDRNSPQIGSILTHGSPVLVQRVDPVPVDNRIRAKVAYPDGWITLRSLEGEGFDYAKRKKVQTKQDLDFDEFDDAATEVVEQDDTAGVGAVRAGCLRPTASLRSDLLTLQRNEVMRDNSFIPHLARKIINVYLPADGVKAVVAIMGQLIVSERTPRNHKRAIVLKPISAWVASLDTDKKYPWVKMLDIWEKTRMLPHSALHKLKEDWSGRSRNA
eukprot:TRINITY_DN11000_c0_g1_i7.p1 TRINITY_DN11000_c0_g1~~TRINITY_DN11000_c0_g1_i7.p1  ORF type:complete len:672 (+),score=208.04 TRINITY_DN11000_c0_g1_i7:85-2100(+)